MVLDLVGLGLFGLVTAAVASWFVQVDDHRHDDLRHHDLKNRLAALESKLDLLLAQQGAENRASGDREAAIEELETT